MPVPTRVNRWRLSSAPPVPRHSTGASNRLAPEARLAQSLAGFRAVGGSPVASAAQGGFTALINIIAAQADAEAKAAAARAAARERAANEQSLSRAIGTTASGIPEVVGFTNPDFGTEAGSNTGPGFPSRPAVPPGPQAAASAIAADPRAAQFAPTIFDLAKQFAPPSPPTGFERTDTGLRPTPGGPQDPATLRSQSEARASGQARGGVPQTRTIERNGQRITQEFDPVARRFKDVAETGVGQISPQAEAQRRRIAQAGRPTNIGTIPPGFQLESDDQGRTRLVPIPGGPADTKAQESRRQRTERTQAKERSSNIVTQDIDRALNLIDTASLPTTGLAGDFLSNIGGTSARDVRGLIDTVRANVGFDKLQAMREASPTGGALGQVSERENALLQATMGNLDQSQSREQLEFNLKRLSNQVIDTVHGTREQVAEAVRQGRITQQQADQVNGLRKPLGRRASDFPEGTIATDNRGNQMIVQGGRWVPLK